MTIIVLVAYLAGFAEGFSQRYNTLLTLSNQINFISVL
jgi:hypothetical protein